MINRIGLACLAAILTCTWCAGFVAAADELRITFLHVNDVHGQLESTTQGRHSIGGYARLSTAVSRIRQTHPTDKLFLIHAGDEFSRGDELTAQTVGYANIELMNYLRFDIWTPGNGDFYIGLPSLKARIAQATCKVVGANVTERIGGKKFTEPFAIEQAGPIKIAFLGLCFTRVEHPASWAVKRTDPVDVAQKLVPEIRKRADLVVAVTHIGLDEDQKLAAKVPGIDLVIGAHTHSVLPQGRTIKRSNGTQVLIAQAGDELKFLGQVDLTLSQSPAQWRITQATAKLIPLDEKIPLDPQVTALIARLAGAATQPATTRPAVPTGGTPLGAEMDR